MGRDGASGPQRILRWAYQLMTERTDQLAMLMTLEMGKPIAESAAEIAYAADFLRWFRKRRSVSTAGSV